MTEAAQRWWKQELEMVRNRVKLRLKKAGIYTGNPMTARQGIAHLHSVRKHILDNLELYK